jgi:hypothetical protein
MAKTAVTNEAIPDWLNTDPNKVRHRLSRRAGWQKFVDTYPKKPTAKKEEYLTTYTDAERKIFDNARFAFHRSFIYIKHSQVISATEAMDDILAGADADVGPGVGVVITAGPLLGKTSLAIGYGRDYQRGLQKDYPAAFEQENALIPVCYSSFLPRAGLKANMARLLKFYGEPISSQESGPQLLERFIEVTNDCRTKLIILDQTQNLTGSDKKDKEVAQHFKTIMDDSGAMLILVGIDLDKAGPVAPSFMNKSGDQAALAGRFSRITMERLAADDPDWTGLLHAVEEHTVLLKSVPGDLSQRCTETVWALSDGAIGHAVTLCLVAANRAVRDGTERITPALLKKVAPRVSEVIAERDSNRKPRRP